VRVTVLGSGSAGNATLVEAGGVRVLIDAGFSGRDLERRLESVGVEADSIAGIVITHDHGDHTRGMGVLARRHGLPLYLTALTRVACANLLSGTERVLTYASSAPFRIGALEIRPFLTVHDAADPVAVTVCDTATGARLGIATDLGRPTAAVRAELAGCHMLVLEANHDDARLWAGPYPWSVKQRIASSHGHMSNRAAAELARELLHPGLRTIVLAHLSEHCNDAALAEDAVGSALARSRYRGTLTAAPQHEPLPAVNVQPGPDQLALALPV
jgi:phosphoribosyl 1,2-cyclic phosphodiesterase